jgi:hypothetical protein
MSASQDARRQTPEHPVDGQLDRTTDSFGGQPFNGPHPDTDPLTQGDGGELAFDVLKGAVAGAVGVWAMDRVDWFMYERGLDTPETRRQTEAARPGGMDPAHVTAKMAADAIGVRLSSPKENPAGLAVHYSLGIMPGMLYGAMRGRVDYVGAGRGLGYGFALFVLEDEIANPLLGTAAPPGRYPWTAHARGLVAHLVYGLVTDAVLSLLNGGRGRPRRGSS